MPIGIVTPATGVLLLFTHKQLVISFNLVYHRSNVNLQRSESSHFRSISLDFKDFFKCNFSKTTTIASIVTTSEIVDQPKPPTEFVDEQTTITKQTDFKETKITKQTDYDVSTTTKQTNYKETVTTVIEANIHWFIIGLIITLFVLLLIACGCLILNYFFFDAKFFKSSSTQKKSTTTSSYDTSTNSIKFMGKSPKKNVAHNVHKKRF